MFGGKTYLLKVEITGESMTDLTFYEYLQLSVNQASKAHKFLVEKVEKHECDECQHGE